jgi:hypothetical protein
MRVQSSFAGIFLDYDTGTNTFFGVNVNDYLTKINSKSVGKALLTALGTGGAPNNPAYNVLIKPMAQAGLDAMYIDKRFTKAELRSPTVKTLEDNKTKRWEGLKMGGGVGSGAQAEDWTGAENGTGSTSVVVWNSSQTVFQDKIMIPHFILLAHELIHCLHNLLGTNKGGTKITVGSESIKHEEVYCVGLGDYAGDAITENAIRAQWAGVPNRNTYG